MISTSESISRLYRAGVRAARADLFLAHGADLGGVYTVPVWSCGRPVLRGLPSPVTLSLALFRRETMAQRSLNLDCPFYLN